MGSSTPSVVVLALASAPCSSSVCPWTTVRSPSWPSACTHPLRCPLPWWSHTTLCSPPTPSSSTLTWPSCLTTRLCTTSAVAAWTSSVLPTPTWCHTLASTSWCPPTRLSSLPRRPTTSP